MDLESTRREPFVSTSADIEHVLRSLSPHTGARSEDEAYDVGHAYSLAHDLAAGLVEPPLPEPWTRLTAPALTPALRDAVAAGPRPDRRVGCRPRTRDPAIAVRDTRVS